MKFVTVFAVAALAVSGVEVKSAVEGSARLGIMKGAIEQQSFQDKVLQKQAARLNAEAIHELKDKYGAAFAKRGGAAKKSAAAKKAKHLK